ncbi:recombinase family protein [Agrobacterium pusense]|uniref:recombinase family protein n=1 Tax=Agrobacterium pusense TaxID=648995 RepID=UPI000D344990|nr:recombinase family protein [Agrobacterium pusense]PTV70260.1 hypothetical protein DBL06_25690 [Agrobacterium pusense]
MTMIGYTMVAVGETKLIERKARLVEFGCDKVYSERSGGLTQAAKRVSLGHALRAVKAGDDFVVENVASIGRTELEGMQICAALLKRGVNIIGLDDAVDTRSSDAFSKKLAAELADKHVSEKQIEKAAAEIEKVAVKTLRLKIREPELRLLEKLVKAGKSTRDIAQELNVNETAVRRHRRRLGLVTDERFKTGEKGPTLPASEYPAIARRIDAGETVAQLAAEYGVSQAVIGKAYRTISTSRRRKIAPIHYSAIISRVKTGEKIKEIAASYGVSNTAIKAICELTGNPIVGPFGSLAASIFVEETKS